MKKRRILIIHEYGIFQSIIKRILTAEVPDVDLHMASSAREAVERLDRESFDMVISANEMEYKNGTDIFRLMKAGGRHKETGFLLLTSKLDRQSRRSFEDKGIDNVLQLPFQAGELARMVEKLSSPRIWRRHRRIFIPDTSVQIESIQAKVVNLSLGGMLCDLKVTDGIPQFSRFYQLNILFPAAYGSAAVNAQGYTLRQAALQWLEPPEPEILQTAWRFSLLSEGDTEIMKEILDKAFHDLEAQGET